VHPVSVGRDAAAEALVMGGLLTATRKDYQGAAAGDAFGLGPGEDRDVLIYQGHIDYYYDSFTGEKD